MPDNSDDIQREEPPQDDLKPQGGSGSSDSGPGPLGGDFKATLRPPADTAERERYDELLLSLYEEFLPCSRAEWLVVEEIAALELRRIRVQEALTRDMDLANKDDVERLSVLSRCETDLLSKLDKRWKRLGELQDSRGQRRGLALEAALVRRQVEAMRRRMRDSALALAERALSREMTDFALSATKGTTGVEELLETSAPSGDPVAHDAPSEHERADPELPPLPEVLPGPPWNPWHGIPREQLEVWNDELIEREKARLRRELEQLERGIEPPVELQRVSDEDDSPALGEGTEA